MQPGVSINPPPEYALKQARGFKLVELSAPADIQEREPKVVNKLQSLAKAHLGPVVQSWPHGGRGEAIVIQPEVEKLKFISGGERFFAGALAGSSAIQLRLRITEERSGRLVANPLFYQHANAFGGAHTFGTTDNLMLDRVVQMMADYLRNNYERATGGATGDS